MGNQESIIIGMGLASTGLAPFSVGRSIVRESGVLVARSICEYRYVPVVNKIAEDDQLMSEHIVKCEIRYCHISGAIADASLTLAARSLGMTTQAAHHHFIILTLESGTLVYIDKHGYRNIMIRHDKRGLNGGGTKWLDSAVLKIRRTTSNIYLKDVVNQVNEDKHSKYNLLDDNCQHFAKAIYDFVK